MSEKKELEVKIDEDGLEKIRDMIVQKQSAQKKVIREDPQKFIEGLPLFLTGDLLTVIIKLVDELGARDADHETRLQAIESVAATASVAENMLGYLTVVLILIKDAKKADLKTEVNLDELESSTTDALAQISGEAIESKEEGAEEDNG